MSESSLVCEYYDNYKHANMTINGACQIIIVHHHRISHIILITDARSATLYVSLHQKYHGYQ